MAHGSAKHGECHFRLGLLIFLCSCVSRIAFVSTLLEAVLTLLGTDALVLVLAFLTLDGEIYSNGGLAIEICQTEQLVSQHASMPDMIKHKSNELHGLTSLLKSGVVKDEASGSYLL